MSENTATRLQTLMDLRGLKQADILRLAQPYCEKYKIKLGKSDLSQFVNGKVEPGQWKITILSLALNVSEAWLMGLDVPMEKEIPTPVVEDGLEAKAKSLFNSLSDDLKDEAVRYLEFLASKSSNL